MAMITCPNCGGLISDKAKKCIHCGKSFDEGTKRICVECGAELEDNVTECSECGCPVDCIEKGNNSQTIQQVEVAKVSIKPKVNKKKITAIVVSLVVFIGVIFGASRVIKQNAKAEYGKKLKEVSLLMLDGASDAETSGNLIKQVWYNSIYEERSSSTDKYTRPDGYFVSDFNKALGNLFDDDDFSSKIDSIKSNQEHVEKLMKEMKKSATTENFCNLQEAYEDLQKYYDSYVKLTNLVINPTGSLQTFSNDFNDADTAVSNAYSKVKLHFD